MYSVTDTLQERLLVCVARLQPELAPRLVLRLGSLPEEELETLLASHEELVCAVERALVSETSQETIQVDSACPAAKSIRKGNKIMGPPPGFFQTSDRELRRPWQGVALTGGSDEDTPGGNGREIAPDTMRESTQVAPRSCDDGFAPSHGDAEESHCEASWTDDSVICLQNRVADLQPEMSLRITQGISDLGPEAVQECLGSDVKLEQHIHRVLQDYFAEESAASLSPRVNKQSAEAWLGDENAEVLRSRRCDASRPHPAPQNVMAGRRDEDFSRPITSVGRPQGLESIQASCRTNAAPRAATLDISDGQVCFGHHDGARVASPIRSSASGLATSQSESSRKSIWGLESFLQELDLSDYHDAVQAWSSDMGAAYLEELVENATDLSDALCLKPLERKRLERQGADVARSVAHNRPGPSSDGMISAAGLPRAPEPNCIPASILAAPPPPAFQGKTRRI